MSDVVEMTLEEREASIGGIGTARKRKEDARFTPFTSSRTRAIQ